MQSRSIDITFPKWINARIPYVLDSSFSSSSYHMTALQNSINVLKDNTCIRIIPRTTETKYLKMYNTGPSGSCNSGVGMIQAGQPLRIADWCTGKPYSNGIKSSWYSMVHELMHAMGFVHEQCRTDRDDYVWVNMSHPEAQYIDYQKMPLSSSKIVSKYDYDSLMHYPGENGLLETYDSNMQDVIGQRSHLSDCDIAKINRYYECSGYDQSACPVGDTEYYNNYWNY